MHQFRTEHLQPFPQFFKLMLDVFFYGGSFMKAVTNVDVHEHLGYLNEAAATQCLLRKTDSTVR
jgi:hypothetical protein